MPHLSRAAEQVLSTVKAACSDATTANALAERVLGLLQPALRFDGAEIFGLDSDALLFTRVLAHRGGRMAGLAYFLRDVYLRANDPEWLDVRFLLAPGRRGGTFHERYDRWLRAEPPAMSQAAFTRLWRRVKSPAGGGIRYGIAHRGRWVALFQAARWEPGPGFSPSDLELLDRVAPTVGAALGSRIAAGDVAKPDADLPAHGSLLLDGRRDLVAVDAAAEAWLARLSDDGLAAYGLQVPVVVQSVVNHVAGSNVEASRCHVVDRHGTPVAVSAMRARPVGRRASGTNANASWYSVAIDVAAVNTRHPALRTLSNRQREVAGAVARGRSDKEIAAELSIAASTVHDHVAELHRRLGTRSRGALVARLQGVSDHSAR